MLRRVAMQVNRHQRSSIGHSSHLKSLLADEYGQENKVLYRSANYHHRMVSLPQILLGVSNILGTFLHLLL
jgi:hypothetical protein